MGIYVDGGIDVIELTTVVLMQYLNVIEIVYHVNIWLVKTVASDTI